MNPVPKMVTDQAPGKVPLKMIQIESVDLGSIKRSYKRQKLGHLQENCLKQPSQLEITPADP